MKRALFPDLQSPIFIYGPPGCGKTSLGRRLAESLGLPFYDLDQEIERRAGISIPEIFAAQGETGFRQQERAALEGVLDLPVGVVALGGGALLSQANRSLVEASGPVLCLAADFDTLLERGRASSVERPLIQAEPRSRLAALMAQRGAHYASFPLQLDTGEASLEESVWEAQARLGFFHVSGMGAGYDVRVVETGLDELGPALMARGLNRSVAIVSDENVAPLYGEVVLRSLEQAGFQTHQVTISAGEAYKTIQTVQSMWTAFLEARLERGSTVVALGGGVVGDLAGFAAATYMRGVDWVAVPTSLLAMVDASLGGKTGADLPQGKNLVGAFHPPVLVLADPQTLSTLPDVELRNGMAEVVKHGVLADPALFDLCRQGWEVVAQDWAEIVRRAMAVKVRVIQEDPFEKDRRASLNLGHTLGHAIELASDFRLKHGEAVAVGMVFAARLAERMGIAQGGVAQEIVATLQGLGLPTEIPPGLDRQQVLALMGRDKKRAGGTVGFVLPVKIGEVRWGVDVGELSLEALAA
jgi:shikimate kinase/3-dehydroquinate synthase